jgi:hypothetical protein
VYCVIKEDDKEIDGLHLKKYPPEISGGYLIEALDFFSQCAGSRRWSWYGERSISISVASDIYGIGDIMVPYAAAADLLLLIRPAAGLRRSSAGWILRGEDPISASLRSDAVPCCLCL